ncbi:hypothetical protein D3C78_988930 [compost metagenome]
MITLLLGRQYYLTAAGLARRFALLRGFNAVVDSVTHQVHQRVSQGLNEVLVEVGFFADQFQVDFFLQLPSQVANQPRETPEDFLDRLHAGFHHRGLQIGGDHVEVRHRLGHGFIAAVQAQAHQAVTHQHQFADHVHDLVQARGIDPHGGFRFAGRVFFCRRSSLTRRCCSLGRSSRRLGHHRRRSRCGLGGDCSGWSGGSGHAVRGEFALAMQLIEQRFKFMLRDVIA